MSLTDHVIGDMNLDLPFCFEGHLAFYTLVGLLLQDQRHKHMKSSIADSQTVQAISAAQKVGLLWYASHMCHVFSKVVNLSFSF